MGAEIAAFEAIYREHFREFVRVAAAICGDADAAADVVHDAFASALRNRDMYRGAGSLDGWLWRTVVNTARNHRRRRMFRRARFESLQDDKAESRMPEPSGDPEVRALLARLPERQRTVLFLRYYGDLGYAEIAEALGIRPGTVGATMSQAHEALRGLMEKEGY